MLLATIGSIQILSLVGGSKYVRGWLLFITLMVLFYISYFSVTYLVLANATDFLVVITGLGFFVGVLATYVAVRLGSLTIKDLSETTVSKEYTENIIQSMMNTLIALSPDLRIETANQSACNLLGYTEEEIIGMPMATICPLEELFGVTSTEDLIQASSIVSVERTYLSKDGSKIPVLFSGSVAQHNGNGGVGAIVCVAGDITERKRGEALAREAEIKLEEVKRYEAVHSAREEERKSLAAEIHDDVLGRLAALGMDLGLMQAETNGHLELNSGLVEAREKVRETASRLREIVRGIYPSTLTNLGLLQAVTSHLSQLALRPIINPYPIEVSLHAEGFGDCRLPEAQGIAIYRTIEQAIANIIAHAQASKVSIHLVWGEAEIELCISDDGKGFDESRVKNTPLTGHFGLATLRYRAEALGGNFEIESQLSLGTTIRSTIPAESPGPRPGEVLATTVLLTAAAMPCAPTRA